MNEPNIDYSETGFSDFAAIKNHVGHRVNNLRYLSRKDAVSIAECKDRFAMLEFNLVWILVIALAIFEAVYFKKYFVLVSILIPVFITIYGRRIRWWMAVIVLIAGLLIPNITIDFILINCFIAYILYQIWYYHVRKLANKVLLSDPELFEKAWMSTAIAIAIEDEVYFHHKEISRQKKDIAGSVETTVTDQLNQTNNEDTEIPVRESGNPRFCNKCGAPLIPGAKFCNKCRAEIMPDMLKKEEAADPGVVPGKNNDLLSVDNVDQIRKWKKLLDEGIISEEEFSQKKKDILGI